MAGQSYIPGLSGQRCAGDMAHRAPERSLVGALRDHRGEAGTRDRNAADRPGRRRCTDDDSRRSGLLGTARDLAPLALLKDPSVYSNIAAITQNRHPGADERKRDQLPEPLPPDRDVHRAVPLGAGSAKPATRYPVRVRTNNFRYCGVLATTRME